MSRSRRYSKMNDLRKLEPGQLMLVPSTAQEFNLLTPNNTIYKLIGGALIKQDPAEAKANVRRRLEFLNEEMCVELTQSEARIDVRS